MSRLSNSFPNHVGGVTSPRDPGCGFQAQSHRLEAGATKRGEVTPPTPTGKGDPVLPCVR